MTNRLLRSVTAVLLLASLGLISVGCAHEGPMERAGRHVDNAASDAKHDAKEAVKGD